MRINLSEKGGMPNGIRNLVQTVLFVSAGACAQASFWGWFSLLMMIGVLLFATSAVHYFLDNYNRGFRDGKVEGERVRGLILAEDAMLESNYRILTSMPMNGEWLVVVEDLSKTNEEPRAYILAKHPPAPRFRRVRLKDDSDPESYLPGYETITESA